ncbi:uncharacterized protein F5Z01DRAFT_346636 [Emericellopsis atlantica]|uniref:DUF4604 domain-containing protein n=1 Tax=Emericellopsis atlantica TaxID=2614577 RepID=A0A9P7ZFF8_9HYPO|nr:uncharacterized protein F5Z01DRAFT_346636 [Emericellopsis atlantica]KAG9250731.1 hypothetical protein F5Z01DRAFT_346636 [Emericellopsis atlantica]
MSQKITGKNLSYDTSLPPFLQALRSQTGGSDQPQTTGQRRAAKKRSDSEDAEDVPVVVDENGNVVTVEVDKEGQVKPGEALDPTTVEGPEKDEVKEAKTDAETAKAAIGGRKRKVGRLIGDAGSPAEQDEKDGAKDKVKQDEAPKAKKPKKKAQKIKLSFDDED